MPLKPPFGAADEALGYDGLDLRLDAVETGRAVSLEDLGAVGDGSTDDTAAFVAAASNSEVHGTQGKTYLVDNFIIASKSNIKFVGNGAKLKRKTGDGDKRIGTFNTCTDIRLTGFEVDLNNVEKFGGIVFRGCQRVKVRDNHVYDSNLRDTWNSFDHYAFVVNKDDSGNRSTDIEITGNVVEDSELCEPDNCDRVQVHHNICLRPAGTVAVGTFTVGSGETVTDLEIEDNIIIDPRKVGIYASHEAGGLNNNIWRGIRIKRNSILHLVAATGTGDTTSGSPTITNVTGTFVVGQYITAAGVPITARVTAVGAGTLTLSANATATASGVALTSSYAGVSRHIGVGNFTGSASSGNSYEGIEIEDNFCYRAAALSATTSPHLNVLQQSGNTFDGISVKNNKVFANTTDWAIDVRRSKEGRISDNVVRGTATSGQQYHTCDTMLIRGNRSKATTNAFGLISSAGNNVLADNTPIGAPTNVWHTSSALTSTDRIRPGTDVKSVASAATVTLPLDAGDVVLITGTTSITSITATGMAGRVIVFVFSGALTLTDGSNLKLNANFVTTADDAIPLACDGTNWYAASVGSAN